MGRAIKKKNHPHPLPLLVSVGKPIHTWDNLVRKGMNGPNVCMYSLWEKHAGLI